MTKLEEEMFIKLKRTQHSQALKGATQGNATEEQAKAAAQIAIKWIKNAFTDGYYAQAGPDITEEEMIAGDLPAVICWKRWLKENGITE